MAEWRANTGFQPFAIGCETGMLCGWLLHTHASVFWTHAFSLDFVRRKRSRVSSVTRRRALLPTFAAQKNGVRNLRQGSLRLVRPESASGARSVLRRHTYLSGHRGAASPLPELRQGEARTSRLSGRQPALYQALRLVRRQALPAVHGQGCCQGAEPGLAYGQGAGQAIHAYPAGAGGHAGAKGDWHRRNLDQEGAYLPHCGQRPCARASDLVWRTRPLGGQHGSTLRMAG